MRDEYFEVRFKIGEHLEVLPASFAIITAYATTGETWTQERNSAADRELEKLLRERTDWVKRVTGYSPETGHAEPGWAATVTFEDACDIGLRFHQDAIYFITDDELSVSHCDRRRKPVRVGVFTELAEGESRI